MKANRTMKDADESKPVINADLPAFPCPEGHIECYHPVGLSKREHVATEMLKAMVSSAGSGSDTIRIHANSFVESAIDLADYFLKELERKP